MQEHKDKKTEKDDVIVIDAKDEFDLGREELDLGSDDDDADFDDDMEFDDGGD
jgi:hypothetical protein